MEELIRVVKELQATTGRLDKERILQENKGNDFIKGYLNLCITLM